MKPAIAAFTFLAACVAVCAFIVPDEEVPHPMWVFVFLVLAVSAKFCWSHPKAPQNTKEWLLLSILGILVIAFMYALDFAFFGVASMSVIFDLSIGVCGIVIAATCLVHRFFNTGIK